MSGHMALLLALMAGAVFDGIAIWLIRRHPLDVKARWKDRYGAVILVAMTAFLILSAASERGWL